MTVSAFSGPLVTFGQSPYTPNEYNPDAGTSLFYAGAGIMDPRTPFTYLPGQPATAFTPGFLGSSNIITVDAVPYTAATAAIVASANPTSATLTLVSANSATTGVSITTSLTNSATGVADTSSLVALDSYLSFTASITGTVMTVTANSNAPITPGAVLLTAGGTGTLSTGVKVLGFIAANGGAGTYRVSQSQTIGSGTITAQYPNVQACTIPNTDPSQSGMALWNPSALLSRALTYTAAAGATYTTATATGYDCYGYPMTEQVTLSAGATVTGKKAFKYVKSVVLSGGSADTTHAYSVGTADVFGLPIRADTFGEVLVNYATSLTATTLVTSAASLTIADLTNPATNATGDVRGTYAATSSTGANRLVIRQTPSSYDANTIVGLFGVTQA